MPFCTFNFKMYNLLLLLLFLFCTLTLKSTIYAYKQQFYIAACCLLLLLAAALSFVISIFLEGK
jgi:hypothetical protein